jgi:hypothetical protein
VKRVRRHRNNWYVPSLPPEAAVFVCRGCGTALTVALKRLDNAAELSEKPQMPLVPKGYYWQVSAGHPPAEYSFQGATVLVTDFTGHFALPPDSLRELGCHPDPSRWSGCCGPSGLGGPNRICRCGQEVGTERSDCLYSVAIYLDPERVRAIDQEANQTPDPSHS